jgi:DNA-directed RNA polymerase subunit RPC12/RpoP
MEGRERAAFEVECPHCHKRFIAPVMEGSAARYRGFKCPHCRLFVPAAHGEDRGLSWDRDA